MSRVTSAGTHLLLRPVTGLRERVTPRERQLWRQAAPGRPVRPEPRARQDLENNLGSD